MLPYALLLIISALLPLFIYRERIVGAPFADSYIIHKRNKLTIYLFFAGLFILLMLRDITVGKDLDEYKLIFEHCYKSSFGELPKLRWEIGYTVYNKVLSLISKNYRFLLTVTAYITLLPIYKLYVREKRYSVLLIALFINMPCFLMLFSGLRQAIAISIGVFAYMAIQKKRYILCALLILLAISFHISAAVLVLLYPAFFLKIKAKHLLYIAPAMLAVYFLKIPILMFIIGFLPSHYIQYYGEIQQTEAFGTMVLFLVFLVFSFVILDEKAMSKRDYFLRNILLIATVFQFFVPIHGLVQRASYYFMVFIPISILSIVQAPKRTLKNISDIAVVVMSCFFLLYFFYNASFSTDNLLDVFPYKFLWSGQGW